MGGFASGRYGGWGRGTVEGMLRLDVRRMAKLGSLTPGQSGSWIWSRGDEEVGRIGYRTEHGRMHLSYRCRSYGDEWESMAYPVTLTRTPCHMGGARAWFLCPAVGCGRRVAILYGGRIFACRHCHRLAYPSTREGERDRLARAMWKIRQRMGWEGGLYDGHGPRPKGMHRRTYEREVAHYYDAEDRLLGIDGARLPAIEAWLASF